MSPWEETEDYIRSGHRNPDDFSSLKTIVISKEQGIKAIVGRPKGKDTTEVQSYLFMKSKDWTMAKAKAWFKEHRERRISIIAPVKEKLLSEPRKVSGILALPGWSRNRNLWLPEEIEQLQAAFVHAPIYYEHIDSRNVVGQTDFVAFDPELGLLAYYGGIFDEDTADKIDKGLINFVSLGVNYTRLDQVNGVIPRGPYHDGEISLVAVPGVQGTSIQVAEKLQGEKKGRDKMGEHETGEPKTGTHGTGTKTSTHDDPVSEPKKPTMSEKIEKELNEGPMGLAAKEAGQKIKVTQEGPLTFKIGVVKGGQAAEQESPKSGEPKTDRERLIAHFGEDVALKLLDLIGDKAYKLPPPRGTKVGTADKGAKEQRVGRSIEDEIEQINDRIVSIWNTMGDIQRDVHRHEEAIKEINEKIFLLAKESDKPPQDDDGNNDDDPPGTGGSGEVAGGKVKEKAPKPPESQPADDDKKIVTPPPPEPEPKTPGQSKDPPISEGVVDPSAKPVVPDEFVKKADVLALLPDESVFRRAPFQLTELVRRIRQMCK